jgi:hypothetical protein
MLQTAVFNIMVKKHTNKTGNIILVALIATINLAILSCGQGNNCSFALYQTDSVYRSNCISCHEFNNSTVSKNIYEIGQLKRQDLRNFLKTDSLHVKYTYSLDKCSIENIITFIKNYNDHSNGTP